jgi:hypothetical protein
MCPEQQACVADVVALKEGGQQGWQHPWLNANFAVTTFAPSMLSG